MKNPAEAGFFASLGMEVFRLSSRLSVMTRVLGIYVSPAMFNFRERQPVSRSSRYG